MRNTLEYYLNSFIEARIEEISLELSSRNKEYKELREKIKEFQDLIINNLSDEFQYAFFGYEEAEVKQDAVTMEAIYKQGLFDGIRLSSLFKQVSKFGRRVKT